MQPAIPPQAVHYFAGKSQSDPAGCDPDFPLLAERLLAARTEANGGYLDLRDMDLETLVLLFNAADSAYSRLKREGAQGCAAPAFYEGLLKQFQQLRDMLHTGRKARMRQR